MCENLGDLYKLGTERMQDAEFMARGEARQKCYTEARNLLDRALNMVQNLSIFSDNESLDDIATENIKYLLIPAYLARVILSSECRKDRLTNLRLAENYLKLFLRNIINYGLGDQTIEKAISNDAREPTALSTSASLESAAFRRNQKIERYKNMKLLENQLNELSNKIESSAKVDDEVVREYNINLVKKWISDSLDSLELEVKPAIFFEQNRPSPDPTAGHSDQMYPTTTTQRRNTPETLTLVRDNLQKQVFGAGYPSRPTVTVDEFISKKIKDGDLAFTAHKEVYSNSLQRYAEKPSLRREQDEMIEIEQEEKSERDDAEELRRKRQWDEFKDETPRGSEKYIIPIIFTYNTYTMCENKTEPLAKTRSRRSNAGARMHEMMFAAEDDELFAQTYGGLLKADDDSSDDEEYIPKEVDTVDADEIDLDDDDEGNDDDNDEDSDEDEESSSEGSSDQSDNEESDMNDEHYSALSSSKTKSRNIANYKREGCEIVHDLTGLHTHNREKTLVEPGSPGRSAYESCAKICCVCLGDQSGEDDEIIECDSCGVAVHESCYGVAEEDTSNEAASNHSNISSESTEPWFCEACRRSVRNPNCELCPNKGGIFKQTDTGRWVHMVCALYTRGVTFENIDTLTEVSLFELSPALYGSKTCTICEDRRLARSGICIGCDAGLCKIFFHATCAQKEGLLFESHSDEIDPYFAQCKQHADKSAIKKKKRICTAIMARFKKINPLDDCSEKVRQKLSKITQIPDHHLTRWTPANPPPIPSRIGRSLMTSPSLITKLTRKSELLGLDPQSAFMNVQDEQEAARQKWHVPPAFSLEFIAYCHDRTTRMVHLKRNNTELVNQNLKLKIEEANLRERYNSMKDVVANLRLETESMVREARNLQKSVSSTTGKQFSLPLQLEQMIARSMNSRNRNNSRPTKSGSKTSSTHCCGKCNTTKDQHLLSLCDTCNSYIHIYCLDPPLSRVPKKTKFGGWQCSDCSERDEEEQEEAQEEQINLANQDMDGPRRLRERIKYPEKYCQESMMIADFWSNSKRRSKKSKSSRSKSKKAKVEHRVERVH